VLLNPSTSSGDVVVLEVRKQGLPESDIQTIPCTITNGLIAATPADDTFVAGSYLAQFRVTWHTGEVETFPNDGFFKINVDEL
jgi:hypothetical protein